MKSKMVRVAAIVTVAVSLLFSSGCRYDPADDIELFWPEGMERPQKQEQESDYDEQSEYEPLPILALESPHKKTNQVKEFTKKNPDAVGWLYIPDTTIDEVVVQDPDSNETYYRLNSMKEYDFNGCLIADFEDRVAGDANRISPNLVIYGHSMTDNVGGPKDEKKFTQLKKFLDKDFAEKHPYIFFSNQTQDFVFEIFAVTYANSEDFYYVDCDLTASPEEIDSRTGITMESLVERAKAGSIFNYPVTPVQGDKIITLSTCTYKFGGDENKKQRYVVFGRLLKNGDEMKENVLLDVNENPVMPTF